MSSSLSCARPAACMYFWLDISKRGLLHNQMLFPYFVQQVWAHVHHFAKFMLKVFRLGAANKIIWVQFHSKVPAPAPSQHRLIRRTSSAHQCVSDGALEREFGMTEKQNGNCVLWFPGPYSQLSAGNFLKVCSLQCCALVKDRFFAALFIHKLQFVPPFWRLNVDIWRSQSAIQCSSCIFNTGRDMRAGETVTYSFIPKLALITPKTHLSLPATPLSKTMQGSALNKVDELIQSHHSGFIVDSLTPLLLRVVFRGSGYL